MGTQKNCFTETIRFAQVKHMVRLIGQKNVTIAPWHMISNNVVCAVSVASDQPAHTRSLIRDFACCLYILWKLYY